MENKKAEVQLINVKGTWNEVVNRARTTVHKDSIEKDEPLVKVFLLQFFGEERKIFLKIFTHFSNFD